MSHFVQLSTLMFLLLGLAGCGDSGGDDAKAAVDSPLSDLARYDKEMNKKGCELLSAELVSKTFDVPADNLMQMKIAGCRYNWNDDEHTVEAAISMIRAHKSEKGAAGWFASATRNKTAEEMQAEMAKVSEQLNKQESLDTDLKQSTAQNLLSMVGTEAVQFEDVPGVGDEARVSNDGIVYVREENLTFMVTAYKGAVAPQMDMTKVEMNQIIKAAKEHADNWTKQTAAQRKHDGALLARAIVDGL